MKNKNFKNEKSQTYGTGSPIDGASSILPVYRTSPLVDGTGRFIAGRAPLFDRAVAGAEPLAVFLLLLSLGFLAGVSAGGTGRRTGVVVAVGAAVVAGVVVIQYDRQSAADVAQLTPKSRALAPGAFQLAVKPGAGRCVLLHHHAEFCLQTENVQGNVSENKMERDTLKTDRGRGLNPLSHLIL